jgi:branched-chain amino acid transport system substrate-binding protein
VIITPASTSPKLKENVYSYIFRIINGDNDYGRTMARYAAKTGLKKVAVYYSDDDYGRGLANAFEDNAYQNGIEVIDRTTSLNDRNVKEMINKWNAFDCDSVFIADVIPDALEVIKLIRSEKKDITILGATGIDRSSFIDTMGMYAKGIVMPTVFYPGKQDTTVQNFVNDYKSRYKNEPDTWAAQGYETVKVLCHAIEMSHSVMPKDIAKSLLRIKKYNGVTGSLSCSPNGEITGENIYVKVVRNGKYVYLGSY